MLGAAWSGSADTPARCLGAAGADDPAAWALTLTVVLAGGYSLAAAYTLPWYDVLVWAGLPAVLGAADAVLLARLVVISCAYVPGRVLGMTPGVEDVTMAVRTRLAPLLVLAVWGWLVTLAVRSGSVRWLAGRPRGRAPRR